MRRWVVVVVAVLVASVSGCAGTPTADGPPAGDVAPPAGVGLSFGQLRNDEGTDRAQLRVVNGSAASLRVTGVGLDWPGFGDFLVDYDTVVEPGRTLDLRFSLPEPQCRPTREEEVRGRLRLATEEGEEVVAAALDETGAGYVTRIRTRWCEDRAVARAVRVSYADAWRLVGSGRRARLVGAVTVERRGTHEPVTLASLRGSVLLETGLPRPLRLREGQDVATSRLTLTVPRCDEHAFIDSSQTFHFLAGVRLGARPVASVYRLPGAATRRAAERLLDEACVVDGAID